MIEWNIITVVIKNICEIKNGHLKFSFLKAHRRIAFSNSKIINLLWSVHGATIIIEQQKNNVMLRN